MKKHQHSSMRKIICIALALMAFLSCVPLSAAKAEAPVPVTCISLGGKDMSLLIGQTKSAYITFYPYNATNRGLIWTSSNNAVASVDSGNVTGVSKGKAVITVRSEDGGFTDKCKVTVKEVPAGVTLDWDSVRLCPGDTTPLKVFVNLPAGAALVWSSDKADIASVQDGALTANSVGSANIKVSSSDGKYSASLLVDVVTPQIVSSYYSIDREKGVITGVPESTCAGQLRANLDNTGSDLAVVDKDGKIYKGTNVATGMSVKLVVFGKLRDTLKVAVGGDCNGDGAVTVSDMAAARFEALGLGGLKDEYLEAADINGDGTVTAADYTQIKLDILGVKPLISDIPVLPEIKDERIRKFFDVAFAQRGKPYLWGAEGQNSFDCSGFIYYCLKESGYGVARTTANGYSKRKSWLYVAKDNLKPGDLMFFRSDDNPRHMGHIAIYLGNGYLIHASSQYGGIVICPVKGWYWDALSHGRRVWR